MKKVILLGMVTLTSKCTTRIILFIILSTFSYTKGFSQKCKFSVDKTDPISNKKIKEIHTILWGDKQKNYLTWVHRKEGEQFQVQLGIVFEGEKNEYMDLKDTALVKLENGTIFKLIPKENVAPTSTNSMYSIFSIYAPYFDIDKSIIEQMVSSRVIFVRISLDKECDFDFMKNYEKNCKKLMISSNCILQE